MISQSKHIVKITLSILITLVSYGEVCADTYLSAIQNNQFFSFIKEYAQFSFRFPSANSYQSIFFNFKKGWIQGWRQQEKNDSYEKSIGIGSGLRSLALNNSSFVGGYIYTWWHHSIDSRGLGWRIGIEGATESFQITLNGYGVHSLLKRYNEEQDRWWGCSARLSGYIWKTIPVANQVHPFVFMSYTVNREGQSYFRPMKVCGIGASIHLPYLTVEPQLRWHHRTVHVNRVSYSIQIQSNFSHKKASRLQCALKKMPQFYENNIVDERKFLGKFGISLHEESEKGHLEEIKDLCIRPDNINEVDRHVGTPLDYAIRGFVQDQRVKCLEVIKYLLSSVHANPNAIYYSNCMPRNHRLKSVNQSVQCAQVTQYLLASGFIPDKDTMWVAFDYSLAGQRSFENGGRLECTMVEYEELCRELAQLIRAVMNTDMRNFIDSTDSIIEIIPVLGNAPLKSFLREYQQIIIDRLVSQLNLSHFNDNEHQKYINWFLKNGVFIDYFLKRYRSTTAKMMSWYAFILEEECVINIEDRSRLEVALAQYLARIQTCLHLYGKSSTFLLGHKQDVYIKHLLDQFFLPDSLTIKDNILKQDDNTWVSFLDKRFTKDFDKTVIQQCISPRMSLYEFRGS